MTDILVEHEGPIATVVFNRPQMRNAISLAMWTEIARVTEGLAKDDSVRAVVYRGAGRDAFASGADISEFKEHRDIGAGGERVPAGAAVDDGADRVVLRQALGDARDLGPHGQADRVAHLRSVEDDRRDRALVLHQDVRHFVTGSVTRGLHAFP